MSSRPELIKAIQDRRSSKVICYVTGDRQTFPPGQNIPAISTRIATEPQLFFYEHLKNIGHVPKIDLVLYTRGGDTDAVWPFVNLIREFCDNFSVLIPFRSHSAGTMIALGADEIVMTEVAELSPIDPTTVNPFNPRINQQDPNSPQIGISVEDVTSYIKLAREGEPKLKDETSHVKVFEKLADYVHPLALGNVNRVYNQIRHLAENLLRLHPVDGRDEKKIIDHFCEKLYSHHHAISRREATSILGDIIKKAEDKTPELWDLFDGISTELCMNEPFNLKKEIGSEENKDIIVKGALIESEGFKHVYQSKLKITQRSVIPPNMQLQVPPGQSIPKLIPNLPVNINVDVLSIGWVKE